MPIALLRPTGPGTLTQWSVFGAATNWQAALASDAAYVHASPAGLRDRYTFEDLPAEAAGVTSVTEFADAAGDSVASTMRLSIGLSGVESLGSPLAPLEGGFTEFSHTFPTAPGALAWTVARVNALEGGPDTIDTTTDFFRVDRVWLVVDYTIAGAVGFTGERRAVVIPGGARGFVRAPGARADVVLPVRRIRIPAGPAAD